MKKISEMNDQPNTDPMRDQIAAEIIARIETAAKLELAALGGANADLEKLRKISGAYSLRLEEKKARLAAERVSGAGLDIVASLQTRRNLEREIAELELSMQEFEAEFWPVAVKAADVARSQIGDRLHPIALEMKNDFQAQLDALFVEVISTMESFRGALNLIGLKSEFCEIRGHIASLASFDLSPLLLNRMNHLCLGFGTIEPKKGPNLYEVVVRRKEPIGQ